MIKGLYTALITPFSEDLSIDEKALRKIVELQIEAGVDGLVPMGTTGESPTVSHKENLEVIRIVIEQSAGRVPVIAGTGSNSTQEAVDMTIEARKLGASYSLQVAPYYNKPNQEGFYRHFMTIAEKTELPLIVYNIPGRSAKNIETPTIIRLAQHELVVAVKEASGNLNQVMDILASRPDGFSVLSGVDEFNFLITLLGGEGAISVLSNVLPKETKNLLDNCLQGRVGEARREHYKLLPFVQALFLDTNPIPVKYALSQLGQCGPYYRLPLCEPSDSVKQKIDHSLRTWL